MDVMTEPPVDNDGWLGGGIVATAAVGLFPEACGCWPLLLICDESTSLLPLAADDDPAGLEACAD